MPVQDVALRPELERKVLRAEVEGARIGDRQLVVNAVERQRGAVGGLARDPGRAVNQRAGVAVAGQIRGGDAGPFSKGVGVHQAGGGGGGGAGNIGVPAEVTRRIGGAHLILVRG